MKTLVIGASENTERYSNKAIKMLLLHKHEVVAIGNNSGTVEGVAIQTEQQPFEDIHTVTIYINPKIQKGYYDYILALKPQRVIFNPGTTNTEFIPILEAAGIETIEACTLVMLSLEDF